MSGGKEKAKINNMVDQQYAQNQQDQNFYMGNVKSGLTGSQSRADDMYNVQFGGYKDFATGGRDFDPSKYGSASSGVPGTGSDKRYGDVESSYRNFMSGGGVDTGRFNQFQGNLMDVAGTGGYSEDARARILGDYNKMRATADDADVANNFLGNGVYKSFTENGGLSDTDRQNIRQRATSVIPSIYGTMRDEANRTSAVQGGYGPGRSAMFARMGRDQAAQAQDAALNAELGITSQVNQNKLAGAQGLTAGEGALQNMRLSALGNAASGESSLWDAIARNRTSAAGTGGSNETGMQDVIQRGKMFGTQGLEGLADKDRAAAAASSAQAAADAKWRAQFDAEQRQFGLSGMTSLYGTAPAEVGMYLNAYNQGRNANTSAVGTYMDALRGAKGNGVNWGAIAGAAASAAPYIAMASSDRNLKTDIEEVSTENIRDRFKSLPIFTWRYKGDSVKHLGPMAQDMHEIFGVGDGHTIALVDVMGLLMLLGKAIAEEK